MAAGSPLISAIIPLRNRGGTRLDNCLRSLRWQTFPADQLEIVLSDFGSDPSFSAELRELGERHDARVVCSATDAIWNRSKALNIGIRSARGRYVFCTDADMIFSPDFVQALADAQERHRGQAMVMCRCRDLSETVPEQPWERDDFPRLLDQASFRERLGTGACQMASKERVGALRGYDEGYKFWGLEDTDMRFRAARAGFTEAWVHDDTAMLHQWHPSDRKKKPLRKFMNDARFHLTKYVTVKNWRGWGKV